MNTTTRTDLDAVTALAAVLPFLPPALNVTIDPGTTRLLYYTLDDAEAAAATLGLTERTERYTDSGDCHTAWTGNPDAIARAGAFTVTHCALAGQS